MATSQRDLFVGAVATDKDHSPAYSFNFVAKTNGASCTDDNDCLSNTCSGKGVCCFSRCDGVCRTCTSGTCQNVPEDQDVTGGATTCTGDLTCDGRGECKKVDGRPCSSDLSCASGQCFDGVCCEDSCELPCRACNIKGNVGKCTFVAAGTDPIGECIGKDRDCGGACDGKGQCEFPGIGTRCGTQPCQACDGTGRCNTKPPDDDACDVIDCDKLDTTCRDYADLDAERCAAFGKCKAANDPASCTKVTELPCGDGGAGGDGGASGDGGSGADGGSSGGGSGGCSVGARADGTLLALGLCLLLILWRRRRR